MRRGWVYALTPCLMRHRSEAYAMSTTDWQFDTSSAGIPKLWKGLALLLPVVVGAGWHQNRPPGAWIGTWLAIVVPLALWLAAVYLLASTRFQQTRLAVSMGVILTPGSHHLGGSHRLALPGRSNRDTRRSAEHARPSHDYIASGVWGCGGLRITVRSSPEPQVNSQTWGGARHDSHRWFR
jgi:hypothetical protein